MKAIAFPTLVGLRSHDDSGELGTILMIAAIVGLVAVVVYSALKGGGALDRKRKRD